MTSRSCASPSSAWATKAPFAYSISTVKATARNVRNIPHPSPPPTPPDFFFSFSRTEDLEPASMFHPVGSKATVCAFPYMPGLILTGHESGKVALFDASTGEEVLSNERAHMDVVTDLQLSPDRSYFITSSKDKTARIHDAKTLTVLKTFPTETPLNSAALAPNMPYVRPPPSSHHPPGQNLRLLFFGKGSAWRWSGSDECHDDIITTRQIRSAFLASCLRRGSRPRQRPLWSAQHVRHSYSSLSTL